MKTFNEFVDRKNRESQKHLTLMKQIFEKSQMQVTPKLDDDNPYIFLHIPNKQLSFEGVRLYQIGDTLAYRAQKKPETQPYGRAYPLDLEEMFEDYMEDDIKENEAAEKIVQAVVEEMQQFFKKSADAEDEIRSAQFDRPNGTDGGKIILKTAGGTDYSNMVSSKV